MQKGTCILSNTHCGETFTNNCPLTVENPGQEWCGTTAQDMPPFSLSKPISRKKLLEAMLSCIFLFSDLFSTMPVDDKAVGIEIWKVKQLLVNTSNSVTDGERQS